MLFAPSSPKGSMQYQTGRYKIVAYLIFSPTDSAVAAAAVVSSALGVAARAHIFRTLHAWTCVAAGAHMRAFPTTPFRVLVC